MHLKYGSALLVFFILSCAHKQDATLAPGTTVVSSTTVSSLPSVPPRPISNSEGLVPRGIDYARAPEVVAFSCCANQDAPQPLWNTIAKHDPDLFIFTGNVVYSSTPEQKPAADQYRKLTMIPEYRNFREKFPVMAMWNDHDFGQNDGGADNPDKELYKKEFMRHFPYVKDSIAWNQGGLFHVKYIGGNTTTTGRRRRKIVTKAPSVQVIMLDTRYYRSPLKKAEDPEHPLHRYDPWDEKDKSKNLLGEEQWEWLEDQLRKPADFRFLVSSIQVIATEHGFEKWANFPRDRNRLMDMIKKLNIKNMVIVSGDRNIGTIAKADLKGFGPIFDITAGTINRPADLDEKDASYLGVPVKAENFGIANIDWKKHRVKLELRDIQDQVVNSVDFKF